MKRGNPLKIHIYIEYHTIKRKSDRNYHENYQRKKQSNESIMETI